MPEQGPSKAFQIMVARKKLLRNARGKERNERMIDKKKAQEMYEEAMQAGGLTVDESHALMMM